MGTDLVVAGRTQLAGYAGLGGAIRGRARPFAIIAAVDVLAVALAFGAIHLTGMMMGGGDLSPLIPPVSAATEPVAATTPLVPPAPRVAPAHRQLAARPDAAVMFARPVAEIDRGFTFAPAPTSSSTFAPSPAPVAVAEPENPPATPTPMPRLRPLERVAEIATPVIDAADGSLDRLLLRGPVAALAGAAGSPVDRTLGNAVTTTRRAVGGVAATVGAVTGSSTPVQAVAQSVTQPVAQAVQGVASLLR